MTKSVDIECTYTQPLRLKLPEKQADGLEFELEEVEEGHLYRLTATTVPPLRDGVLNADAKLETGVAEVPEVRVHIRGYVHEPVAVLPRELIVVERMTKPALRLLTVRTRKDKPIKVLEVIASDPAIKTEVQATAPNGRVVTIRVTLPPAADVPDVGATITIKTDDEEFAELVVPIIKTKNGRKPTASSDPEDVGE